MRVLTLTTLFSMISGRFQKIGLRSGSNNFNNLVRISP